MKRINMIPLRSAVRNLVRYPKKTVWIALILFLFASALTVAALIYDAAERNLRECEESYETVVSIIPDVERLIGSDGERGRFPRISLDEYMLYAGSSHVREIKISGSQSGKGVDIFPVGEFQDLRKMTNVGDNSFRLVSGLPEMGERLTIMGSETLDEGECMISMEAVRLNGLSIGDEISFRCEMFSDSEGLETSRTLTRTLVIVGIFEEVDEFWVANDGNTSVSPVRSSGWRSNDVYITFSTLMEGILPGEYGLQITVNYILNGPGLVTSFDADLREMGLDSVYRAAYDESGYQQAIKPAQSASNIATAALWILPLLCAAVLLPLSLSSIHARRKETALLKAMGMRTSDLAIGILIETLLITAICAPLGFAAGTVVAQSIVDVFVKMQSDKPWSATLQAAMPARENIASISGSYRIFMRAFSTPEISVSPAPIGFLKVFPSLLLAFLVPRAFSLLRLRQNDPLRILEEVREGTASDGGEI